MSVATKNSVGPRCDDSGRVGRECGSRGPGQQQGAQRCRLRRPRTDAHGEQPALHRLGPLGRLRAARTRLLTERCDARAQESWPEVSVATKNSVGPRCDDNVRVGRECGSRGPGQQGAQRCCLRRPRTDAHGEQPALHRRAPLGLVTKQVASLHPRLRPSSAAPQSRNPHCSQSTAPVPLNRGSRT